MRESGEDSVSEQVTFLATLPDIQSAIKITGTCNGMRVQLEVPESEMGQAIHLLKWRGQVIEITAALSTGGTDGGKQARQRSSRSPLGMVSG